MNLKSERCVKRLGVSLCCRKRQSTNKEKWGLKKRDIVCGMRTPHQEVSPTDALCSVASLISFPRWLNFIQHHCMYSRTNNATHITLLALTTSSSSSSFLRPLHFPLRLLLSNITISLQQYKQLGTTSASAPSASRESRVVVTHDTV